MTELIDASTLARIQQRLTKQIHTTADDAKSSITLFNSLLLDAVYANDKLQNEGDDKGRLDLNMDLHTYPQYSVIAHSYHFDQQTLLNQCLNQSRLCDYAFNKAAFSAPLSLERTMRDLPSQVRHNMPHRFQRFDSVTSDHVPTQTKDSNDLAAIIRTSLQQSATLNINPV